MEYSGGTNLFTSHFIIGHRMANKKNTKTETIQVAAYNRWLEFKENDFVLNKYLRRTDFVAFLDFKDLDKFKKIVEDLFCIYTKKFPDSKKSDFISYVFEYTIGDLEYFLGLHLNWLGEPRNEDNYTFFTSCDRISKRYEDFAIRADYELEHYKQFYRAALDYLDSFVKDISPTNKQETRELTINQIALKYVYSGNQVTRKNSDAIIVQYGHKSGEKLFHRFTFYSSAANRKGIPHPCTAKKLKNKIDLLESVIELVPADKQTKINVEVSGLKRILEAEYL